MTTLALATSLLIAVSAFENKECTNIRYEKTQLIVNLALISNVLLEAPYRLLI